MGDTSVLCVNRIVERGVVGSTTVHQAPGYIVSLLTYSGAKVSGTRKKVRRRVETG